MNCLDLRVKKRSSVLQRLLPLALSLPFFCLAGNPPQVSPPELSRSISSRIERVEEFHFIREEAAKMGVRVWLFGGTAAGFAHYVKWDLLREKGDKRYQPDRFDYDYTNIYRSTQDLDIVVDGNLEQVQALQNALQSKFKHFQGSKQAWEVRSLTHPTGTPGQPGYKEALLNDAEFSNQHTDSNSTGMIEISETQEPVVRDLRDWNSQAPIFLRDVAEGKIHYYYSEHHQQTARFKAGINPPIFSVIRALTKAFQYELELRPSDWVILKKLIDEFDTSKELSDGYAKIWIEKNGAKLIQHAVNIEYAWDTLERIGLRKKLIAISDPAKEDTMGWWLNREPLRSRPIGANSPDGSLGKTAAELGIEVVAHETNNFLAYESITRAHTGDPNVLISRQNAIGETAAHGDGFYTRVGRKGARGTGLTIRFTMDPRAREGSDFILQGEYVIVRNKKALRVIPESLNFTPVQFFEFLAGSDLNPDDRALLEKLNRRLNSKVFLLSRQEINKIVGIVSAKIHSGEDASAILGGWLKLSASEEYPDLLLQAVQNSNVRDYDVAALLLSKLSSKRAEVAKILAAQIKSLEDVSDFHNWRNESLLRAWLVDPQNIDFPEVIEQLMKTGDPAVQGKDVNSIYLDNILSHEHWLKWPRYKSLLRTLIKKENVERSLLARLVFSQPFATQLEPELDLYLSTVLADYRPHETPFLGRDRTSIIGNIYSKPHWAKRMVPDFRLFLENWKQTMKADLEVSLVQASIPKAMAKLMSKEHFVDSGGFLDEFIEAMDLFKEDRNKDRGEILLSLVTEVFTKPQMATKEKELRKVIEMAARHKLHKVLQVIVEHLFDKNITAAGVRSGRILQLLIEKAAEIAPFDEWHNDKTREMIVRNVLPKANVNQKRLLELLIEKTGNWNDGFEFIPRFASPELFSDKGSDPRFFNRYLEKAAKKFIGLAHLFAYQLEYFSIEKHFDLWQKSMDAAIKVNSLSLDKVLGYFLLENQERRQFLRKFIETRGDELSSSRAISFQKTIHDGMFDRIKKNPEFLNDPSVQILLQATKIPTASERIEFLRTQWDSRFGTCQQAMGF